MTVEAGGGANVLAEGPVIQHVLSGAARAAFFDEPVVRDPTQVFMTPLGNVVLVLPKAGRPERSPGGVVELADVEPILDTCGLVIKAGASFRCEACDALRAPTVQVGEWVLFNRGAGGTVTLGGTEYLVLQETEILAVIDDPTAVCEVV